MTSVQACQQALGVLPPRLRQEALALPQEALARAEEFRLRAGWPMSVVLGERERFLNGPPVEGGDLERLVEIASQASLHAVLDQLRRGYLTVAGGHRLGLCGTAVLQGGGIHALRGFSSANLRVARQVEGAAAPV